MPVPIVMCGKFAEPAAVFAKMMLPEYEVVHHFMSADEAVTALPQVMGGTAGPSASGVGSNNNASSKTIPKAMFVGGGFWEEELERMRQVPEGHPIPWIASDPNAPDMVKVHGLAAVLPMIVERAKGKFRDIGVDDSGSEGSDSGSEGSEGAKPGLYRY